MTEHENRLREAFETHENQTPDPALVYARVEVLARKHKWRRRSATAAGGAVLSAGLIAGVANLPAILPGDPAATVPVAVLPAAAPASPSVAAPTPSTDAELQKRWDAYFRAGYNYTTAVELAKLWKMNPDEIGLVKAEAGRRLLAGETLPLRPLPEVEVEQDDNPDLTAEQEKQLDAFFNAGYTWDDAVELAKLWKLDDPSGAKFEAGKRLLDGKKLPVRPDPKNVAEAKKAQKANAFWEAGYDYEDAEKLAKLWKLDDTYQAKVMAGAKLLAGETLPIQP
ncbi:hypothetical protein [Actinoplanes aureus]|uniref:Uncharacterized protein n=1 Tax=Actinoplanes aureus TaxID=2792083 RepID=A0A931C842_9ACTN|nr:hypothetical protein [Actinoplanes aureus]MBG0562686.1 hypothetical protein [Actinoplanes aureus]